MKKVIVLSADIVASTSINTSEKINLENNLNEILEILTKQYSVYGRILKGDYIEMVIENPIDSLTIVLMLKSFIKKIQFKSKEDNIRIKSFRNYGIRIAMGFGILERYDKIKGIIDGEAIYFSGRKISSERTTHNKKRIVVKNTLFFESNDERLNENFNTIIGFIDYIINKATAKQSEILYLRLSGLSEHEIAEKKNIRQPTVNKQLSSLGWNHIEKAVQYFRSTIQNY